MRYFGAGNTDVSPTEQEELRRKSKLSPQLEKLSENEFTGDMLRSLFALTGLSPFARSRALTRLEQTVKTSKRS
jgi:hypothetical protein